MNASYVIYSTLPGGSYIFTSDINYECWVLVEDYDIFASEGFDTIG